MSLPSCLAASLATVTFLLTFALPVSAADGLGGSGLDSTGVVVSADAPVLPEVAAASWVVADLDTGDVLAAKNAHGLYAPASTLKMLTAVTLLPVLEADRLVVPTFDDIAVEGSKVGLVQRVSYPVTELFGALLMVSGNDAANVLASAAGGQLVTAQLMNDRARELGALDTHAVNPHGLDATGQVSSAYDLAVIARAGLADPRFARYVSTRRASVGAPLGKPRIETVNKNKLLRDYAGALGVKNGYTTAAGASFVGAAERDGRRLVVSMMRSNPKVFDEATKLLDWGFATQTSRAVGSLPTGPDQLEQVTSVVAVSGRSASADPLVQGGTSLPVTLAGLGLAVAAVVAVRRPAPVRHR
jgi:D-alanyl-D-alanine carboxypeptidase (penicillin-binding protein 5/6)